MAGSATLRYSSVNPDGYGYEIHDCTLSTPTVSFKITPTLLKGIDFVSATPMNAEAATAAKGYLTSFVIGGPDVTITSVVDARYLVKIEGKV